MSCQGDVTDNFATHPRVVEWVTGSVPVEQSQPYGLTLHDFSAAIDIIDHTLLFAYSSDCIGMNGTVLK